MRIVRLIARLNIGGPARHVTILDRGLRARGHDTLLVFGPVGAGEGSLEDLTASLRSRKVAELGRRIRPLDDVVAFARIVALLFRERPDVVHTHTAKAGTLGRLAAAVFNATRPKRRRALVVHTFHGHVLEGYFGPVGDRLVRLTERGLGRLADRIVALSPAQRADLCERFRICPTEKVDVVGLGLELDDLLTLQPGAPSLRDVLAIPGDAVVIGYVGRLVPIKDLPKLIDALCHVVRECPAAVLLLAGDGPERPALEAQVAARGLADHVRFAGWQRDLAALYATCSVVALVSRNEGTPVALIEAMAAGLPVVSTAVGGVPDVVAHARTGLLVDASASADEVGRVIGQLVTDPMLRRQLGHAARLEVRDRFSSGRLIDDIERLYLRGLEHRRQ